MNWVNANIKICRALAKKERVCGHYLGEDRFFVTPDGCYAYIFPKDKICFNIEKVKLLTKPVIRSLGDYVEGPSIRKTRVYVDLDIGMARKFDGDGYSLFVKEEYLKPFEGLGFYQSSKIDSAKLQVSPVLIVEEGPVGLVLPVRILDRTILKAAETAL